MATGLPGGQITKFTKKIFIGSTYKKIPFVDFVIYFGVILDKKPTWKEHIDNKNRTAKFSFIRAGNGLSIL